MYEREANESSASRCTTLTSVAVEKLQDIKATKVRNLSEINNCEHFSESTRWLRVTALVFNFVTLRYRSLLFYDRGGGRRYSNEDSNKTFTPPFFFKVTFSLPHH